MLFIEQRVERPEARRHHRIKVAPASDIGQRAAWATVPVGKTTGESSNQAAGQWYSREVQSWLLLWLLLGVMLLRLLMLMLLLLLGVHAREIGRQLIVCAAVADTV